ncbi:zinc finger BED domain-containing protein RICESLEEPER 2-like [Pyrus communis]|uniref:zinc finger BED domain-containing protein RICESLEEPER 2-like n=1 Tax=Pyrus communis TaxID=23211 RepID=UPI0035BEFC33
MTNQSTSHGFCSSVASVSSSSPSSLPGPTPSPPTATETQSQPPTPPQSPTQAQSPTQLTAIPPLPPLGYSKRRSTVWEHFVEYDEVENIVKPDGTKETIIRRRARCKYCSTTFAANPSGNGTSTIRKHIEGGRCKSYPGKNLDKRQKTLSFDDGVGTLMARGNTKEDCIKALVQMVVLDELPFTHVEGRGFRFFCSVVCPHFYPPSRRTLARHFVLMYDEMKAKLKTELALHRVSLTTDTWTSIQKVNYMVITAHFIDSNWKLHKRILNFCVIANHKGNSIGKLLEVCLLEWGLENVLTITVDNASSNKVAVEYLKTKMCHWQNSRMILKGKHMHVRCCAHIVNLIVQDGLRTLDKSILAIRNALVYVTSSPQRVEAFRSCVKKEKIECKGLVFLDVPTRWNSTYLMLTNALKFEKAFVRMGDDEIAYLSWFGEDLPEEEERVGEPSNGKKRYGPPNMEDWSNAAIFVNFLKVFYQMTLKMSVTLHPACHSTFSDLLAIDEEIVDLFIEEDMLLTQTYTSLKLHEMARSMKVKFDKYWGDLVKVNPFLFVGLVLDPRYKLGYVPHILKRRGCSIDEAMAKKDEIKSLIFKLYDEYVPSSNQPSGSSASSCSNTTSTIGGANPTQHGRGKKRAEMDESWIKEVEASNAVLSNHEFDRYLLDRNEKVEVGQDFDILNWWKLNGVKYPVLALIAKEVLAIPVSTVASESAFSTGGRIVNSYRSSLTPLMVERLICTQNWLMSDNISILDDETILEDIEFYEALETDSTEISLYKLFRSFLSCLKSTLKSHFNQTFFNYPLTAISSSDYSYNDFGFCSRSSRGGNRNGRVKPRGSGNGSGRGGEGRKKPVEKSVDELDKELDSYHADNMQQG